MAAYISFQPTDVFNTKLYTGTAATLAVTGVGFQPDWIWLKSRSTTSNSGVYDSVRGVENGLASNLASAPNTSDDGVEAFGVDGFTLGTNGNTNASGTTYVSWNWKAGTTSGIATNGSTTITPTGYSFNQTSGFSVLKYSGNSTSGAKVAHGLGATPAMVMVKSLGSANNWSVYHKNSNAVPEDYTLQLDTNAAAADNAGMWNDTAPDSVNLTLGNDNGVNGGYDYVAYCFADVKGFSKFGTYTGNAQKPDGPFIYTGFRPAFVMVKIIDTTGNWYMWDNRRSPSGGYNLVQYRLEANQTSAEGTNDNYMIDMVSNGFKIRDNNVGLNGNGNNFVYAAFAEFPLVSSNSKAGTAR